jgi:hypothetical protein
LKYIRLINKPFWTILLPSVFIPHQLVTILHLSLYSELSCWFHLSATKHYSTTLKIVTAHIINVQLHSSSISISHLLISTQLFEFFIFHHVHLLRVKRPPIPIPINPRRRGRFAYRPYRSKFKEMNFCYIWKAYRDLLAPRMDCKTLRYCR